MLLFLPPISYLISFFSGYLAESMPTFDWPLPLNVNHSIAQGFFCHLEPGQDVASLSPAVHRVGFKTAKLQLQMQCLNSLSHFSYMTGQSL